MRAICFDPVTGASGDMILAALLDLGADQEYVVEKLLTTGLQDFELDFQRKTGGDSIVCGYCEVRNLANNTTPEQVHEHDAKPDHEHTHQHDQTHGRDHEHSHQHSDQLGLPTDSHHRHEHHSQPHHHHRRLRDILQLIENGEFPERAKERAAAVFRRLAEAEGAVHGIPPKDVHFHEVGAVDSIVDIVGVCLALEQLDIERVYVADLKIGHGVVHCEHGVMPVPAPATAKLIEGAEVTRLPIEAELTTPTGAALLTTLSDGGWSQLQCRILKVGTGHGRRQLAERPNILRAYLVETPPAMEIIDVIECDLDDQTAEMTAMLADRLRELGALDVVCLPALMKKGRPGNRLSVLAPAGLSDELVSEILGQSSSLGVRAWPVRRTVLPRQSITVNTPWGEVQAKQVERTTGIEIVPEADSCRELADSLGLPPRRIADQARRWEDTGDAQLTPPE